MKKNLSQLKRQRQNVKRRDRNRGLRSEMRTTIRKARLAIAKEPVSEKTKQIVADANKTIDKMVTKGLIHKNTAARYKSRLIGRYNRVTSKELLQEPATEVAVEAATEVAEAVEGEVEDAPEED